MDKSMMFPETQPRVSVLVADAVRMFADSLAIALSDDFTVLAERPTNGPETVEAALRLKPDVALVDYWLPDMEGPAVAGSILARLRDCKVILLSWISAPDHIQRSLDAGAAAFVSKDLNVQELVESMQRVLSGESHLFAHQMQDLLAQRGDAMARERSLFHSLTPRQLEILALLNLGRSSKQIATRLKISPNTVRNHITEILSKTNTGAAAEAVSKARHCGFFRT